MSKCQHKWEFLQTLREYDPMPTSTSTYATQREYAYFTCHKCRIVEKRPVKVMQLESMKLEGL